ncbi:HD domain-containing phosphohydrolase [Undibacterium terreum]|uniref:Two-component system response regulator n=1 Tax=Undibacterium terreum TaxID=1224302 RepID=A0A916U9Q0_9BURK|nr:HD domain-containing phosphohydrolase [Undibacterium terreum]GGC65500.1 two-component system response regulator [Undibacterium terreum]
MTNTTHPAAKSAGIAASISSAGRVLIVDDNSVNLLLLAKLAESVTGTPAVTFEDPVKAVEWCKVNEPDLILVDFMMPKMNGHDFIRAIRTLPCCDDVPIVMVTTENEKAVRHEALEIGATEFLAKPVDVPECRSRIRNLLALRHAQNLLRDEKKLLQYEVEIATAAIVERERELILRLSKAAEFRDPETGAHVQRMAHYSKLIAKRLGMPASFQQLLLEAAPMHDIGKLGIPDYILLKPGKLTDAEMAIMRHHPTIGANILEGSDIPLLQLGEEIARTHHEKFDGTGYPLGLSGENIPLSGRIVAVADVFDALSSERPYKKAWSPERAKSFLMESAGTHFCPVCVNAFIGAWDEAMEIKSTFTDTETVGY